MVQVGTDIRVEASEYKGKVYAVIRRFYEESGVMKPGKAGINMKAEEWLDFCAKFDEIKKEINSKILIGEE